MAKDIGLRNLIELLTARFSARAIASLIASLTARAIAGVTTRFIACLITCVIACLTLCSCADKPLLRFGKGKPSIPSAFMLPIYAGATVEDFFPQKIGKQEWDTAVISTHDSSAKVIAAYVLLLKNAHWTIKQNVANEKELHIVAKSNNVIGTIVVQEVNGRTKITLVTVKP